MKTYQYSGKVRTAAGRKLVFPNTTVSLPEDDEHVKSLVAQGLLAEVNRKATKAPDPKVDITEPEKIEK